jgi:hypothetical protein
MTTDKCMKVYLWSQNVKEKQNTVPNAEVKDENGARNDGACL